MSFRPIGNREPSFDDLKKVFTLQKISVGKLGSVKIQLQGMSKSVSVDKLIKIATSHLKTNSQEAQQIIDRLNTIKKDHTPLSKRAWMRNQLDKQAGKIAKQINLAWNHTKGSSPIKEEPVPSPNPASAQFHSFENRLINMASFSRDEMSAFISEMKSFRGHQALFEQLSPKQQDYLTAILSSAEELLEFMPEEAPQDKDTFNPAYTFKEFTEALKANPQKTLEALENHKSFLLAHGNDLESMTPEALKALNDELSTLKPMLLYARQKNGLNNPNAQDPDILELQSRIQKQRKI